MGRSRSDAMNGLKCEYEYFARFDRSALYSLYPRILEARDPRSSIDGTCAEI